jgi:hypothetical protein
MTSREVAEAPREAASREVGSGMAMGSGTMMGALPPASRPKVGLAMGLARQGRGWCDRGTTGGVEAEGGDDVTSREAVEAPTEAASMMWRRGRRWHRGRKTWAA